MFNKVETFCFLFVIQLVFYQMHKTRQTQHVIGSLSISSSTVHRKTHIGQPLTRRTPAPLTLNVPYCFVCIFICLYPSVCVVYMESSLLL